MFYYSWGRYNEHHAATSYLGQIEGIAPTKTTISERDVPLQPLPVQRVLRRRDLRDRQQGARVGHASTWARRAGSATRPPRIHATDPLTGKNYGTEITAAINAAGFAPLKKGNIGGGVSGKDNCRLFTT